MNPMDIMKLMKGGNPISMITGMLRQQNTPFLNNAADMIQNNDEEGFDKMMRNFCMSRGVNPDEALKQAKKMFGN